ERLQKVIARAGIASRRHAEDLIVEGKVQVNGKVVTELGTKVDPAKDHIKVDGKRIQVESQKIYLLLNKPKGYITSVQDPEGRPTVMDLIVEVKERVYPVGRLDYDTEGLLLFTNDGDLARALMHPSTEVEKTYWAKVKGRLTEEEMKRVEQGGISLPEGKTAPCKIRFLRSTAENEWVEIILHEGKKRQVRMVMEKIGHPVAKLKRVGYAFLKLGNMPLGAYRYLSPIEVGKLKNLTGKKPAGAERKPQQTGTDRVKKKIGSRRGLTQAGAARNMKKPGR
ncbi:MAG TPA: pseudouridine synthase, partial [Candidatus Manganitrophaceae bacterium]|nr:pseudouridine synthase [Candidatus Manganitrophaceae bacterium]